MSDLRTVRLSVRFKTKIYIDGYRDAGLRLTSYLGRVSLLPKRVSALNSSRNQMLKEQYIATLRLV